MEEDGLSRGVGRELKWTWDASKSLRGRWLVDKSSNAHINDDGEVHAYKRRPLDNHQSNCETLKHTRSNIVRILVLVLARVIDIRPSLICCVRRCVVESNRKQDSSVLFRW